MSDAAFLRALLDVEQAWLQVLGATGIAPAEAVQDLVGIVGAEDLDSLATDAEAGGNPVIPLVRLLRERLPSRQRPGFTAGSLARTSWTPP